MFKFKWILDESFARLPKRTIDSICYRTIISHALFDYYQDEKNSESTKKAFNDFIQSYEEQTPSCRGQGVFLEFYLFDTPNGEKGYLIVDPSKGCFPLVIYPESNSTYDGALNLPRKAALRPVVRDLKDNIDKTIEKFSEYDSWNMELENELKNNYFHYSKLVRDIITPKNSS